MEKSSLYPVTSSTASALRHIDDVIGNPVGVLQIGLDIGAQGLQRGLDMEWEQLQADRKSVARVHLPRLRS